MKPKRTIVWKTRLPSVMNRITYLKNRLEIENNVLLQKSYLRLEMMKNIALSKFDIYTIVFFRKLIYVEKVATMYDLSIRQQVFLIFYFSFSEINKFPWKNYKNKSDALLQIDNSFFCCAIPSFKNKWSFYLVKYFLYFFKN